MEMPTYMRSLYITHNTMIECSMYGENENEEYTVFLFFSSGEVVDVARAPGWGFQTLDHFFYVWTVCVYDKYDMGVCDYTAHRVVNRALGRARAHVFLCFFCSSRPRRVCACFVRSLRCVSRVGTLDARETSTRGSTRWRRSRRRIKSLNTRCVLAQTSGRARWGTMGGWVVECERELMNE